MTKYRTRLILGLLLLTQHPVSAKPLQFSGVVASTYRGWDVLRSQQELDHFLTRIPLTRMQKEIPAPPNTDPILTKPTVDFANQVLIVLWSSNIHIVPRILESHLEGADLHLQANFETPKDYRSLQAPYDYGRYCLLEVDRFDGQLKVVVSESDIPRQPLP